MAIKRTFPHSRVKQILKKKHKSANIKRKVDMLMYLDYMLFLKRLAHKAETAAEENGDKTVTAEHIKSVSKKVLKSSRG